jgi:hypothetical protein
MEEGKWRSSRRRREKKEKWRRAPPKFKIRLKISVMDGHLVRQRFFFRFSYFCRKKILSLPYLFNLFEFGDSKNWLTG